MKYLGMVEGLVGRVPYSCENNLCAMNVSETIGLPNNYKFHVNELYWLM